MISWRRLKNWRHVLKKEDIESYIRIRAGQLMAAYGKKEKPGFLDIIVKHLGHLPEVAIKGGFDRAEISFERFPSVKKIADMCGECLPPQTWRYNFKPGIDSDGTPCLIDPDPDCDFCRKPWSQHPNERCGTVVDKRHARYMYRPQDCEEGRAFLAAFKAIAEEGKRKKFTFPVRSINDPAR